MPSEKWKNRQISSSTSVDDIMEQDEFMVGALVFARTDKSKGYHCWASHPRPSIGILFEVFKNAAGERTVNVTIIRHLMQGYGYNGAAARVIYTRKEEIQADKHEIGLMGDTDVARMASAIQEDAIEEITAWQQLSKERAKEFEDCRDASELLYELDARAITKANYEQGGLIVGEKDEQWAQLKYYEAQRIMVSVRLEEGGGVDSDDPVSFEIHGFLRSLEEQPKGSVRSGVCQELWQSPCFAIDKGPFPMNLDVDYNPSEGVRFTLFAVRKIKMIGTKADMPCIILSVKAPE